MKCFVCKNIEVEDDLDFICTECMKEIDEECKELEEEFKQLEEDF